MDAGFIYFEIEKAGEVKVCGRKIHWTEIEAMRWAGGTIGTSVGVRA